MNDTDAEVGHVDGGLAFDLPRFLPRRVVTHLSRRRALGLLGGTSLMAVLAACSSSNDGDTAAGSSSSTSAGGSGTSTTAGSSASSTAASSVAAGEVIPDETAGPFPGDGSNGPNVLSESGVVRQDITSSFGASTMVAEGNRLQINLKVVDAATGQGLAGAAVYLWHCNRNGEYSLYASGLENVNYLRGLQVADNSGDLSFQSIFPGCYSGRWPHVHFEVYSTPDEATGGSGPVKTTQLALPQDACAASYTASGYETSVANLAKTSLSSDNVFRDGYDLQLASVTGDTASGFTASLVVRV